MLATPPFGASSNKALLRANIKPPVELVVADLDCNEVKTKKQSENQKKHEKTSDDLGGIQKWQIQHLQPTQQD